MARFNTDGHLLLNSDEKIIQDGVTILSENGEIKIIKSGIEITGITNDETLFSDSTTILVTEHAIKTYVDDATLAGTSGTSGSSGTSGTSGIKGDTGDSGTSGTSGTSGSSGSSGTSGVLNDPGTISTLTVTEKLVIPLDEPVSLEDGSVWLT